MEVLVFKTSVTKKSQASKINSLLRSFPYIKEVSFDLEDHDKVLRIVGEDPSPRHIESLVSSLGLSCSELKD